MSSFLIAIFLFSSAFAHKGHSPHSCESLLSAKDSPLHEPWNQARIKQKEIQEATQNFSADERADHELTIKAIEAALGKHQEAFLHEHNWKKLDVPRHLLILKAIGEFDGKKPKFSLYKIKRAIEGRHSLREYAACE